jgi:hypothetical protein
VIPIFDSLPLKAPEMGLAGKNPRIAADISTEGGVGPAFSDILISHGASLVATAEGLAGQTPSMDGGNVLLSSGQTLPPTTVPGFVPAVPVFDLRRGMEPTPPLTDTTSTAGVVSEDLLLPVTGQGFVPTELPGAEVILPVTPGLGDHVKKVVGQSTPPQSSVFEPHTVSLADSRPIKSEHAIPAEVRPGSDIKLLPPTAVVTNKPEGGVERAEAQPSPLASGLDINQYRTFAGAQSPLLVAGLNPSPGQNLANGFSFASPVSAAGWGHEFVGRMNLMVTNGVQEVKLQLKPAEMGLLEIKLSTEGDQARVIFSVHNAAARDAIDLAMPRLRDMLEQSGLQLVHSEVNDQSSQRDQSKESDNLAALTNDAGVENESVEGSQLEVAVKLADSLIDYYI